LGERLLCKQEVIGSNPFTSTTRRERNSDWLRGLPATGLLIEG
jgi:hypothetical protein